MFNSIHAAQLDQAARFPDQTVCPNNPTGLARPWRAWVRTRYFQGNFEFETREAAVAYLAGQVGSRPVDTRDGYGHSQRVDLIDYRGTFLQHGMTIESLGALGIVPVHTVVEA